jgi:hypothetical protein
MVDATQSEMNSAAVLGGSADHEVALRHECGPVGQAFAVALEDKTGTSFWQSSAVHDRKTPEIRTPKMPVPRLTPHPI